MEKELRLDKFLADMAKGSRSEVRAGIKKGQVTVNGVTEKRPERKICVPEDSVTFAGEPVSYVSLEYFMLNKPSGVVSATEDKRHRTVLELLGGTGRRDLFPVGRLDKDTEGLLLLTNDGALAHRLLSPKKHVDKVYLADCLGQVPESAVRDFAEGLILPDGLRCLPAELELCGTRTDVCAGRTDRRGAVQASEACFAEQAASGLRTDGSAQEPDAAGTVTTTIRLTIREGKFHQVKRMMEAVGCPVISLKRLSVGPLILDPGLSPGEYRRLTDEELELLKTL